MHQDIRRAMIMNLYSEVHEYRRDLPSRKKEASECVSDVRQQLLLWQRTLCFVICKDRKVRLFRVILGALLNVFGFAREVSDPLLVALLLGKAEFEPSTTYQPEAVRPVESPGENVEAQIATEAPPPLYFDSSRKEFTQRKVYKLAK